MIIVIYIGILLFCYGIYNILSYFTMLPTLKIGKSLEEQGIHKEPRLTNTLIIALSEKIADKWSLGWNGTTKIIDVLQFNKIYYSAAVYCISLMLMALCGLLLCLPLLFWNTKIFVAVIVGSFVVIAMDPVLLYIRYQRNFKNVVPNNHTVCRRKKLITQIIRLLPGVFFLCQIVLFLAMLT